MTKIIFSHVSAIFMAIMFFLAPAIVAYVLGVDIRTEGDDVVAGYSLFMGILTFLYYGVLLGEIPTRPKPKYKRFYHLDEMNNRIEQLEEDRDALVSLVVSMGFRIPLKDGDPLMFDLNRLNTKQHRRSIDNIIDKM